MHVRAVGLKAGRLHSHRSPCPSSCQHTCGHLVSYSQVEALLELHPTASLPGYGTKWLLVVLRVAPTVFLCQVCEVNPALQVAFYVLA